MVRQGKEHDGRVVLPGRHRCLWATELLPVPPGRRGPPPRAHSRPEPSWSRQRHTGVTASPGPGTHWPSRPERWLHERHDKAGVSVATAPTPRGRSPSLTFGCGHRPCRCWPPAADHHSPRPDPQPYPQPYRRPPYPSPPPHHHPQQENQHKPRSITANTRGSSRSPSGGREAGGGGWAASGASWWKRREVATAAKTFAPRDGGGGLNRAWAGRAGCRGPLAQR